MSTPRTTIVSAAELAEHPDWRVFDCSHSIADPEAGAAAYAASHIPGALHVRMEAVLSGPRTGTNGRNPLPSPGQFAAKLGEMGLKPTDQVVCYDRSGNAAATRMWWMLRWIGHRAVAVLDGGLDAWNRAGLPVTDEVPEVQPTVHPAFADDHQLVDVRFVATALEDASLVTVDARGADKFRGENETTDPRAGHIPGALNRPFSANTGPDGLFKSAETLRAEWRSLLGDLSSDRLIASCGSGVSACHNLLALEIAGLPGARLYPGSWSEWCADPSRPIET